MTWLILYKPGYGTFFFFSHSVAEVTKVCCMNSDYISSNRSVTLGLNESLCLPVLLRLETHARTHVRTAFWEVLRKYMQSTQHWSRCCFRTESSANAQLSLGRKSERSTLEIKSSQSASQYYLTLASFSFAHSHFLLSLFLSLSSRYTHRRYEDNAYSHTPFSPEH